MKALSNQNAQRFARVTMMVTFVATVGGAALYEWVARAASSEETTAQTQMLSRGLAGANMLKLRLDEFASELQEHALAKRKIQAPFFRGYAVFQRSGADLHISHASFSKDEPDSRDEFLRRMRDRLLTVNASDEPSWSLDRDISSKRTDEITLIVPRENSITVAWIYVQLYMNRLLPEFRKKLGFEGRIALITTNNSSVLFHSIPSYIGTSFAQAHLMQNLSSSRFARGRGLDQIQYFGAKSPVGNFPFQLLEELEPKTYLAAPMARKPFYFILAGMFSLLSGLYFFIRSYRNPSDTRAPLLRDAPLPVVLQGARPQTQPYTAPSTKIRPSRGDALPTFRVSDLGKTEAEGAHLALQFEMELDRIQDARAQLHRLSNVVSQLCESPILFFKIELDLESANSVISAGFADRTEYRGLTFPVPRSVSQQIQQAVSDGKLPSLTSYEPLRDLMIRRFGISVFEAYACATEQGVTGALVILQPGTRSTLHRTAIARMIRITGEKIHASPGDHRSSKDFG